ncbi:hypothetical protein GUY44_11830 [Pimelobacter simplex]|uniref:hypothetical protein n=1 Tax=Nocardioides simplex TaxID=2045 RepID=UPI000535FFA1|nr:hypothetical protein [Pimelobacter simplex]MCG8151171.1 hypothetical protein [Pimelobacter simplex]GEB17237.1 hypothetical protein NSI01_55520 [Pimelobacter simplex]
MTRTGAATTSSGKIQLTGGEREALRAAFESDESEFSRPVRLCRAVEKIKQDALREGALHAQRADCGLPTSAVNGAGLGGAVAAILAEHDDPPGWTSDDNDMPVYECNCGDRSPALDHDYIYPSDAEDAAAWHRGHVAAHAARELLGSLVRAELIVECQDCSGVGNDLCDVCDGTGRRSGGRCRSCLPIGSGVVECPTCEGHGFVTRDNAESMGWVE